MYNWIESLTSHCVLCCDWSSCCGDGGCCCTSRGGHRSENGGGDPCCGCGACDWVATCCDWMTCGPCRTWCFGWTPCPTPDGGMTYHPAELSVEPPYLELQGSADDNDTIPYEKVFEMEQKKRRLFAAAHSSGQPGSAGSLAQVH